jgi:hypothetical protein
MKPFFALTAKEKGIELLRWVCVLPAAILGDYVGYIIGGTVGRLAQIVGLVHPPSDDSGINRTLRYLIWMFPEGVASVIAAAKTAPRYRLATASVAAVLWILLIDTIHRFGGPTLVATGVAGICGTAYIFYTESSKRPPE